MNGKMWRRLWHFGGGLVFPVLAFYLPKETLLVVLCATAGAFVAVDVIRIAFPAANRWMYLQISGVFKTQERRKLTGTTCLLLSSAAVFFLFERELAITALVFLAAGDPAAATVGEKFGRRKVFGKSMEGSLACLLTCIALGLLLIKIGVNISVPVVMAGAVSATAVELLPLPIDDNFTIPLSSAGMMRLAVLIWA